MEPAKDKALPHPIGPSRPKAGKQACKLALLNEFNLQPNIETPLFGVVSRLYEQRPGLTHRYFAATNG